ncbi:DMT family transporter [Beggiatoa leptomitoformis]|uniref:EamA family transporter n=1 Tax=Beggiatoa leptomitoformis TaxID=288004 RepID=A0A2N9YIU2_9GAMM|nr:DMT family transporter [Beggiatoa leptomitoformis]ALG67444.1 EamA family transporter [Beggiatoa leptomitoformis]AUI70339.1 EamA family transporter [Beggiatoa leptomitoformis]
MRISHFHISPYVLLTLSTFFWGSNMVIGRAVMMDMPPMALAFWRGIVGLLILLPFAWRTMYAQRALIRQSWHILLFLGALSVGGFNSFLYVGLQTTTATNAAILQSNMPIVIIVLGYFWFRQRVARYQFLGILISTLGVLVIICQGSWQMFITFSFNQGDVWVLGAVLIWAVYSLLLQWRPMELHWLGFMGSIVLLGVLVMLPFYLWEIYHAPTWSLTPATMGSIIYVGIFPLIVAYICWNQAIYELGAQKAGQFIHLIPVFGTLLSLIFLGEKLHFYHLIGIILVVIGIYLALFWRKA